MKKILIIGTGSIAKRHILNILSLKKNINIFIYSKNTTRGKNFVNNFKKKNIYLISKNKIDKINFSHVIISSSTSSHNFYLLKFIKKNLNIYCEKPLPLDKHFTKLKSLAKNKKINEKVKIGFQFRFNPALEYLKKELKKRENKKIYLIQSNCGQNLKDWRNDKNYKKFYSAGKNFYSGVVWELCHDFDIMNYLLSIPNKVVAIHNRTGNLNIDVNDISSFLFKFKKRRVSCNISLEMLSPILYRKLTLATMNNLYEIDLVKNIVLKKNKFKIEKINFNKNRNTMFKKYMYFFLKNKIKSKKFDFATLKDGLNVTSVIRNTIKPAKLKNIIY